MQDPLHPKSPQTILTAERLDRIERRADDTVADEIVEAADDYYEPHFCGHIQEWAGELMFPEQWAAELGVSEMTLYGWIRKFPAFARAYSIAITRLRAAFTREMVAMAMGRECYNGARSSAVFANATLIGLIAKKRFADLYGDPPPTPPPQQGNPAEARDITPGALPGSMIEGESRPAALSDMAVDQLQDELAALRARHAIK